MCEMTFSVLTTLVSLFGRLVAPEKLGSNPPYLIFREWCSNITPKL